MILISSFSTLIMVRYELFANVIISITKGLKPIYFCKFFFKLEDNIILFYTQSNLFYIRLDFWIHMERIAIWSLNFAMRIKYQTEFNWIYVVIILLHLISHFNELYTLNMCYYHFTAFNTTFHFKFTFKFYTLMICYCTLLDYHFKKL